MIPDPSDLSAPVGLLVEELAGHLGVPATVALACDLLDGADPATYQREILYLTGHADRHEGWAGHWPRVWGARALLYVWDESATPDVLRGLDDDVWRVAEMCLKVGSRRELPGAADAAMGLARHGLPRVRAQAVRLIGVAGDTEHVTVVRGAQADPDPAVRRAADRALSLLATRLDLVDPTGSIR